MAGSDLIFIIGRQRSGTTVFRQLLARHGAVDCDEIFHGDLDRPHRFFGYVRQEVARDPKFVHPQYHARLFLEYIEAERRAADGRKLCMDVKYFGLNLIPQYEDVDASAPFILNFMRNVGANVAHVIRRNKLRVLVSEEISRATGRWSAERPEHLVTDKPKLHIDPAHALATIAKLVQQDERVVALLERLPKVARIYYDEMFDAEGRFSENVQRVAGGFLGIDQVDGTPANLKMNPESLETLVANYEELARAISETPHAWMLTDRC